MRKLVLICCGSICWIQPGEKCIKCNPRLSKTDKIAEFEKRWPTMRKSITQATGNGGYGPLNRVGRRRIYDHEKDQLAGVSWIAGEIWVRNIPQIGKRTSLLLHRTGAVLLLIQNFSRI